MSKYTETEKVWIKCNRCGRIDSSLARNVFSSFSGSTCTKCNNHQKPPLVVKPSMEEIQTFCTEYNHENELGHLEYSINDDEIIIKNWCEINNWNGWINWYIYKTDPIRKVYIGEIKKFPRPRKQKYGSDYDTLEPSQKQGRVKSDESWKKLIQEPKTWQAFVCPCCQERIFWDKSIVHLTFSRDEAKVKLEDHKSSCPRKTSSEQEKKSLLQTRWEEITKSVDIRRYHECNECWGKIVWDKNIKDAKTAVQQALSDLKYHRDHECNLEPSQRKIAVYHSPNQGGNQHAPIDNSLTDDDVLTKQDNLDQIQKEQIIEPTNYLPYILGGVGIIALGVLLYILIKKRNK